MRSRSLRPGCQTSLEEAIFEYVFWSRVEGDFALPDKDLRVEVNVTIDAVLIVLCLSDQPFRNSATQ